MNSFFEKLKDYVQSKPPNYGDGESVLTMLYECHNENNPYDDEQIKADFNELYRLMNGMELREMDRIIYPVASFAGITSGLASSKESRLAFCYRQN